MSEKFYRVEDILVADGSFSDDEIYGSHIELITREYPVLSRTPKGVWLGLGGFDEKRLVLNSSRKQFASPTVHEAEAAFLARKKRQLTILRARIKRVEEAIEKVAVKS